LTKIKNTILAFTYASIGIINIALEQTRIVDAFDRFLDCTRITKYKTGDESNTVILRLNDTGGFDAFAENK